MPDYDFRTLSSVDFEHLARDILNATYNLRLQSYAAGPDQGIDLRQETADGTIIGQCKHYAGSSWSTFLRSVQSETVKARKLNLTRYLFITSQSLTPHRQDQVVAALSGLPVVPGDVWGREELNRRLTPEVERRHVKLWLSSATVLDTLLHSARWQRGMAAREEVRKLAKFWVQPPALDEVIRALEREGLCVIYGPPGAGKTCLAQQVVLGALHDGWEVVHVSGNVNDAWDALKSDDLKQLFYFNDFLGETRLEMAKNESSSLVSFAERIRSLPHSKRFLMTTRAEIMRAGAETYDALQHQLTSRNGWSGVELKSYPPQVKAEILFNRIYFADVAAEECARLAFDNRLIGIVQHRNYNPRLIALGIDNARGQTANGIVDAIQHALDHPDDLWNVSFGELPPVGRRLLLALATLPSRPWAADDVRVIAGSDNPEGWRPALRILEATWILLTGQFPEQYLALANPSCREYLLNRLDDVGVAEEQVDRIRRLDQIIGLTRTAGLSTGTPPLRPELAHVLRSRRDHLTDLVRGFVDQEIASEPRPARSATTLLTSAAELLTVYGNPGDADWLMDHADHLVTDATTRPAGLFRLAERLDVVPATDSQRRNMLTAQLIRAGVDAIRTTPDLDAFENVPDHLREPVYAAACRAARPVIGAELDHLLTAATRDPEVLRDAAADLEQRGRWYGIDVDVDQLLDLADSLAGVAEPETGRLDDFGDEMSAGQVFARFADDPPA